MNFAAREALWLTTLSYKNQDKININNKPMLIREDNMQAIKLAKNPVISDRSKYIDIKWHFVREKIAEKRIQIEYIPTEDQLADIFTKPLGKIKHEKFTTLLGLRY